jgi:hypothetical protein
VGAAVLGLVLHASSAKVPAQAGSGVVECGQQLFAEHGRHGCHTVGKTGTPIAVDLSRIGARHGQAQLEAWLRDPSKQRRTAHMPRPDDRGGSDGAGRILGDASLSPNRPQRRHGVARKGDPIVEIREARSS